MPNAPVPAAAPGLPPHRIRIEDEFLSLMDQRLRINARLDELVILLDTTPAMLPRSGLRLSGSRSGVILFKGGPIDG